VTHIVDADDERLHAGECLLTLEGERAQHETDGGQDEDRDLQIGVHHERVAVLLQIAFRCSCDFGGFGLLKWHWESPV
jgi:hypothetical protein